MEGQRPAGGVFRWIRRADRRLCAFVLVAGAATCGSLVGDDSVRAAPARVAADQTYPDRTGESRGRLDIASTRLTTSSSALDIRLNLVQKTLNSNENIGVAIDTNGASSGVRVIGVDGFDYLLQFRGGGAGTLFLARPSGSNWGAFVTNPAGYSLAPYDFGTTISASLAALGNPSRIRFLVYAKEADEGTIWDIAPDSGAWDFALSAPPPPPPPPAPPPATPSRAFMATGSSLVPSPPRAGSPVRLGARFVYRGSGATVQGGSLSCKGSVGTRAISGRGVREGARRVCVFQLSATSSGQLFRGRATLTVRARQASVERTARIVSSTALVLTGPRTIPEFPTAGRQYSAAFKVELVRQGASPTQVRGGEVSCRAVVGGRPLAVDFNGFFKGNATCAWGIPASARGAMLVASVTVRSGGLTATKPIRGRVR